MVNVLQRNMSAVITNTSWHRGLEEKESNGFVLQLEELRQQLSCFSVTSYRTEKDRSGLRASPTPELCLVLCQQNCVTVTSSGQWEWGQSLCLWAETPLQSPDTQKTAWQEINWGQCWGNSSSLQARGKKPSHTMRKSCEPKTTGAAGDLRPGKCWSSLTTQTSL